MLRPDNNGFPLPSVIDPERICVQLQIPNDIAHIRAFWGILLELTLQWNWERDDAHTAKEVAAVWMDVWRQAREQFYSGGCEGQPNCREYFPASPIFSYHPCSPYGGECELPAGYNNEPFTVVNSGNLSGIIGTWGLGYQIGDVYTDLLHLPDGDWSTILEGWRFFPRISVTTPPGAGTVKIQFLNIPQGGRALVVLDDDFDLLNLRLIELNKDLVSIPPETTVPFWYELEVSGEGEHLVEIAFLPTVDDTPIPIFFGGGVRSVELCGFGFGGSMDDPCCPDEIIAIDNMHETMKQILKVIEGGFKLVPIESSLNPPDIGAGNCAPAFFDHDTDETEPEVLEQRAKALCITVQRYIKAILLNSLVDMGAPEILRDWVRDQFAPDVPDSLLKVEVRYFPLFEGIAAFLAAMTAEVSLDLIACAMLSKLQGDNINSFTYFKLSLPEDIDESIGVPLHALYNLVRFSNQSKDNYLAFNEALHEAFQEDLDEYECPCEFAGEDGCEVPLELTYVPGAAYPTIVITPMGSNIYHIVQDTTEHVDDFWWAEVRDANGQCLKFEAPPEGSGYSVQGVAENNYVDCADVEHNANVGGFAPIEAKLVQWKGGDPIDTYYKITCVTE